MIIRDPRWTETHFKSVPVAFRQFARACDSRRFDAVGASANGAAQFEDPLDGAALRVQGARFYLRRLRDGGPQGRRRDDPYSKHCRESANAAQDHRRYPWTEGSSLIAVVKVVPTRRDNANGFTGFISTAGDGENKAIAPRNSSDETLATLSISASASLRLLDQKQGSVMDSLRYPGGIHGQEAAAIDS